MNRAALASVGRMCPLAYRYRSAEVAAAAAHRTSTAFIVGGLYGNSFALDAVLQLAQAENATSGQRPLIVFNGDFNWFNAEPAELLGLNRRISTECEAGRAVATAGNIELELSKAVEIDSTSKDNAGCGCAYPDYVDDGVVARSNTLMLRLQRSLSTHEDGILVARWLSSLPLFTRLEVGSRTVSVLHGDMQSVAGWSFAAEAMLPPDSKLLAALGIQAKNMDNVTSHATIKAAFEAIDTDIIACTHTCLPFAQDFPRCSDATEQRIVLINNGSAGMANFTNNPAGVITRIATTSAAEAGLTSGPVPSGSLNGVHGLCVQHYGTILDGEVHVEALSLEFDQTSWRRQFLEQHPEDSPAYISYWNRIKYGPQWTAQQADRIGISGTVAASP